MVDLLKGLKCHYTKKIDSTSETKHSDRDRFLFLFFLSHVAGVGFVSFCFVFSRWVLFGFDKVKMR